MNDEQGMNGAQAAFMREYVQLCLRHGFRVTAVAGKRYLRDLDVYVDVISPGIEQIGDDTRTTLERQLSAFGS